MKNQFYLGQTVQVNFANHPRFGVITRRVGAKTYEIFRPPGVYTSYHTDWLSPAGKVLGACLGEDTEKKEVLDETPTNAPEARHPVR